MLPFTSLRDSFGTQVLEAMAHGLPILTLDHQVWAPLSLPKPGSRFRLLLPSKRWPDSQKAFDDLRSSPKSEARWASGLCVRENTNVGEPR